MSRPANPTAPAAAIDVDSLTKRYGEFAAVDGLGFQVPAGQTVALLGANGAGKTTTISMLLGLLLPTSGRIRVLGEEVPRNRYRVLPHMNFTSPYVDLPLRLSVAENLVVYARLYGIRRAKRRVAEIAEELGIAALLKRSTGTLSAGQKTRVALAKSLLNEPDVLLMDEPTASLDPDIADTLRGYLMAYQRRTGATILLASHNMSEVERLCDGVLMMREGKIVDRGTPAELVARYGRQDLEQVFLDIARHNGSGGGLLGDGLPAAQAEADHPEHDPAETRNLAP